MSLHFFHVKDGVDLIEDHTGSDLPDLEAAREEALEGAREMLADGILSGRNRMRQRFEIRDAAGTTVLIVPFSDAMPH
jgi:hypothetical protein